MGQRWKWVVGGALVMLVVAAATGSANTQKINACVKNSNGAVRIAAPNTVCGSNESALSWPSTALTDYELVVVFGDPNDNPSAPHKQGRADCPAGKVAVGGGANIGGAMFATTVVRASHPQAANGLDGWAAEGVETQDDPNNWFLNVFVVCARQDP